MAHDEDRRSGQELQIVQAFSSAEVSEQIIRAADIKELVGGMLSAQAEVGRSAEELEQARREKKGGSLLGNWWKERGDKLLDAQIDLQKSIGSLSQKSSQLLIVNAAISRVLSDQQRSLLQQQSMLRQQADILEEQNRRILEQQRALEQQQREIDTANRGLLEARDLGAEQTDRLTGSVKRLEQAESQMEALNQQLIACVAEDLVSVVSDWRTRLDDLARDFRQQQAGLERKLFDEFRDHLDQVRIELEAAADKSSLLATELEGKLQKQVQAGQARIEAQEAAARQLRETLSERLAQFRQEVVARLEQNVPPLRKAFGNLELRQGVWQQEQARSLEVQRKVLVRLEGELTALGEAQARLADESRRKDETLARLESELKAGAEALGNAEVRLQFLEEVQDKRAGRHRLTLLAIGLALVSLGWQLAGLVGGK
ncbi:hypothetical protein [Azotobacter salinestris]|uniref:hypothetical protein n=1 Tax=Azotobacter salinestris TaxID=69964 RepID=UPI0032DE63DE